MSRLLESRSFWFRVVCVFCLAFALLVQVLDHVKEEPTDTPALRPLPAHAPGATPPNIVQK